MNVMVWRSSAFAPLSPLIYVVRAARRVPWPGTAATGEWTAPQLVDLASELSVIADVRRGGRRGDDARLLGALSMVRRAVISLSGAMPGSQELPTSSAMLSSPFSTRRPVGSTSGSSSTSKMLSVLMDVFVVLLVLLDILLLSMRPSVGESRDMKYVGIGGSCGAEEPGVGNIKIIFSSNVMLLVSFGSGRWGLAAVLGGGGSGGSCVGLPPGFDCSIGFLVIMEPPDLARRCPDELGDGYAGKMPRSFSGLRGIGLGRFRTDFNNRSSPKTTQKKPTTTTKTTNTKTKTNMMVCCFWVSALASTSTSLALSAIALGFPGRPFVGLRCRAVFTGSGGGGLGEGASCLEGRIV